MSFGYLRLKFRMLIFILAGIVLFSILFIRKSHVFREKTDKKTEQPDSSILRNPIVVVDSVSLPSYIKSYIRDELYSYNWKTRSGLDIVYHYHEVIFERRLYTDTKGLSKRVVITFTGYSGCHVCNGYLSFFTFRIQDGRWFTEISSIATGYGDEWGEAPRNINIIKTGKGNSYGIMIGTGWDGLSSITKYRTLYMPVNNKITDVFFYERFYQSKETYEEKNTKFRFIKSDRDYYDIQLDSDDGTSERYRFKGEEFELMGNQDGK